MTSRRLKSLSLAGVVLAAALSLASATQSWYTIMAATSVGDPVVVEVSGSVAAPAVTALSLSSVALAGALAISGLLLRYVLGVLQLLIGLCIGLSAATAMADPVAASSSLITKATGIAGSESVAALVSTTRATAWPTVSLVLSVVMALLGIVILVTARRWPGAGPKKSSRFETAAPAGAPATTESGGIDPIVGWDELSRGDDPTD